MPVHYLGDSGLGSSSDMELQAAASSFLQCCMGQENFDHYSKIKDQMHFGSHISFFSWLLSTADAFILLKRRHMYQKALATTARESLPYSREPPPSVMCREAMPTQHLQHLLSHQPSQDTATTTSTTWAPPPRQVEPLDLLLARRAAEARSDGVAQEEEEPQDYSMGRNNRAGGKRKQAKPRQMMETDEDSHAADRANNNDMQPRESLREDEVAIELPLGIGGGDGSCASSLCSPPPRETLSDVATPMPGDDLSMKAVSPRSSLSEPPTSSFVFPLSEGPQHWPLPALYSGGGETGQVAATPTPAPGKAGGRKSAKKEDPGCNCHICGRYIKYKRNFKAHMLEVHTNLSKSTCPICQRAYTRPSTLRYHLKVVHRCEHPKMYVCRDCGMVFWKRSTLHSHQQQVHKSVPSPEPSSESIDDGGMAEEPVPAQLLALQQ